MTGIIAEYNPFHTGHAVHLSASDDGCTVAVLSGDYVQRGEPAIADKFTRAEDACRQGVSLVVELPLPWSLSSAGYFAAGAVKILEALHVDRISFGSECGDIDALTSLSRLGERETAEYLKEHRNLTFPAARRLVTGSELLDGANNALGIEYLKNATVPCMTVKRETRHDGGGSAMEIRERMRRNGQGFDYDRFDLAAVSRLRMLPEEIFYDLPDSEDGLGQRLYRAVRDESTLEGICRSVKTKSITLSAVRRLVLCAALGVRKSHRMTVPPYIRVLAFDERGREVLRRGAELPVITRSAQTGGLSAEAKAVFNLGSEAHDLYVLCSRDRSDQKCGEDYRRRPFLINRSQKEHSLSGGSEG